MPARLARVWVVTALVDFLFATALTYAYGSTFARLWQGVATTALGSRAPAAGAPLTVAGIVVHIFVALIWSTVFFVIYSKVPALRRATATLPGTLAIAAVYGPLIWIVMSAMVIRLATGRPPAITPRWWIQAAGHIFFVAMPIVAMTRRVHARQP